MNSFWLILIIGLLIYIIYDMKHDSNPKPQSQLSYEKILPQYLNKMCEITLKEPLINLDIIHSIKGILIDVDDEWVVIEVINKNKKTQKMFKVENVNGITEIK